MTKSWWWLSFCDDEKPQGEQFLGACIVQAPDIRAAIQEAWDRGCNPGGEVMSYELDTAEVEQHAPENMRNRLLSKAELNAAGYASNYDRNRQ